MEENFNILRKIFHPVSPSPFDMGDWNTFLELSKSAKLIWRANAGKKFDKIDLTTDASKKLYVFTDEFPADGIFDFLNPLEIPNYRLDDVPNNQDIDQLYIITLNITELQPSKEIGTCFWNKVLDAIDHDENIDGFEKEYDGRRSNVKWLTDKSFKENLNGLKEEGLEKILIGRVYLLSLLIGDADIHHEGLTRQYILHMFVDSNYFVKSIIEGMGLDCEQEK